MHEGQLRAITDYRLRLWERVNDETLDGCFAELVIGNFLIVLDAGDNDQIETANPTRPTKVLSHHGIGYIWQTNCKTNTRAVA